MVTEQEIKSFYDTVRFPGLYSADDVVSHNDYLICERYTCFIYETGIQTVLDVGCGTGFIANVIAYHCPHVKVVALDFSDTIKHGKKISKELGLTNIEWKQVNFFDYKPKEKFDVVLSNGSIHHMPNFELAVERVKDLSKKWILVGLYNKYGKWAQRNLKTNYINDTFRADQTEIPFELSFSHKEVQEHFKDCTLQKVTPSIFGLGVDFFSLFRGKWGGFTFYTFKK